MANIRPIVFGGRLVGWRDPDGTVHRAGTFADAPRLYRNTQGEIVVRGGSPEVVAILTKGLQGERMAEQPTEQPTVDIEVETPSMQVDVETLGLTGSVLVAASDASPGEKEAADFQCDGIADREEIQAAVDVAESTVRLSTGHFKVEKAVVQEDKDLATKRRKRVMKGKKQKG